MNQFPFRALVFDMDGTLTRPTLDFSAMRKEIGIAGGDLAHEIERLPPADNRKAWAVIERHEEEALARMELQEGGQEFVAQCRQQEIKLGIVTRNKRRSVDHLCQKYALTFDAVITREFPHLKPHPAPILRVLEIVRVEPCDALMIGDYLHDIEAGRAAGTKTCFFQNPGSPDYGAGADFRVSSMAELSRIVLGGRTS